MLWNAGRPSDELCATALRPAFATDPAGSIYLAGAAIIDAATSQTTTLVVNLNSAASRGALKPWAIGDAKC